MTLPLMAEAPAPGGTPALFGEATVHLLSLAELSGSTGLDGLTGEPDKGVGQMYGLCAADLRHVRSYSGRRRQLAAAAARVVLRSALGRALGVPPVGVPLNEGAPGVTSAGGRELAYSVSHDRGTVAVAHHPYGCGVDVEDHPESLFASVSHRFCVSPEVHRWADAGAGVPTLRALWTAKESVAKAMGTGLAAGLRTLTLEPLPASPWAVALQHGAPTGYLVHTKAIGERELSVAVRAAEPPPLSLVRWTATRGFLEPVTSVSAGPPRPPR